jgi:hypothetical protein
LRFKGLFFLDFGLVNLTIVLADILQALALLSGEILFGLTGRTILQRNAQHETFDAALLGRAVRFGKLDAF